MIMAKGSGYFVVKAYKCSARMNFLFFIPVFLLLAAIMPVYTGGGGDKGLSGADALIKEKEYEEAILILAEFFGNNPERFDEVRPRVRLQFL